MSRSVAGAAALALVLQAWLGWPLALRMTAQAASADIGAALVLCGAAGAEQPAPGRGDPDHPPAPGHDHGTCLICHGAAGPLLLLAAWSPPLPRPVAAPDAGTCPGCLAPQVQLAGYAPRGPPVNA